MFPSIDTLGARSQRRPRARAFTLAELSIVILIMSIMAVVSVPRYITSLYRYQADAAARRIKVDLEYLRRNAQRQSASRSITFDLVNHGYQMIGLKDLERPGRTDYSVRLNVAPYKSQLTSAICGGDSTLSFNGYGVPDSSATIVVVSGPATRTITVEATAGTVSIQ